METEKKLSFDDLKPAQQAAAKAIKDGRNALITGPAGTGKSALVRYIEDNSPGIQVTASTGISALNIGGCTINSWASLGILDKPPAKIAEGIKDRKDRAYMNIMRTEKLVIDEVSMIDMSLIEALDIVCRIVRKSDRPFGGIQVIFTGDFCQLPPVSGVQFDDEGRKHDVPARFAFESDVWKNGDIAVNLLSEVIRQKDATFSNVLSRVRLGDSSEEVRQVLRPRINAIDPNPEIAPIEITTHNDMADAINSERLAKLPGDEVVIESKDMASSAVWQDRLERDCIAPSKLRVKVGARVMCLWNVDLSMGIANGTTGYVVEIQKDAMGKPSPVVRFDNGLTTQLDSVTWQLKRWDKVEASREQIPLRLAWAISGHKSQGMTMDKVRLHLKRCFAPGQAYTMLSRVKTLEGLFIADISARSINAHPAAVDFYRKALCAGF